jgi:hypothetical protein
MPSAWPSLPPYAEWSATCDTLHAHTQLLGKLAVALAPPEPQLQHAALRLTARGWETAPLPAPDHSGAFVAALDLHAHEAVIEHSDGRSRRIPLTPDRSVGAVAREVLGTTEDYVGPFPIHLQPQEVAWDVHLDKDEMHHTYDPTQVARYLAAASRAALVLAAVRAPYRGRSSPVNAWWGTFDLAVSLFSGQPANPPSDDFIMRNSGDAQQIELGWWPGDARHPGAAFFVFAAPAPASFSEAALSPSAAHWDAQLGEFILDWDDVVGAADPFGDALAFGRSAVLHACTVCDWDPLLASSAQGDPPPVH